MADAALAEPRQASGEAGFQVSLTLPAAKIQCGIGNKGAAANYPDAHVTVELSKLPPAILAECLLVGLQNHIKQAVNSTMSEVKEAAQEGKPLSVADVTAKCVEAMTARLTAMYNGDMARKAVSRSPVERRALENLVSSIRAAVSAAGKSITEEAAKAKAEALLATPAGVPWLEAAAKQVEAERARASKGAASIDLAALGLA